VIRKTLMALLVLLIPLGAGQAAATPAAETVQRLHSALLDAMRNARTLGFAGRYDALGPVVTAAFNLPLMTRFIAGSFWDSLSPSQQQTLVDSFTKVTTATYAGRFDGYEGERFEIMGEQKGSRRSVVVSARIVKSDGEAVPLAYVLRPYDDRWQIVDVQLENAYSELATRRSEYTSVLRREGFDALIARMNKVVANYAAKP
jgi:phospholipid transport system substrate-binding protein